MCMFFMGDTVIPHQGRRDLACAARRWSKIKRRRPGDDIQAEALGDEWRRTLAAIGPVELHFACQRRSRDVVFFELFAKIAREIHRIVVFRESAGAPPPHGRWIVGGGSRVEPPAILEPASRGRPFYAEAMQLRRGGLRVEFVV